MPKECLNIYLLALWVPTYTGIPHIQIRIYIFKNCFVIATAYNENEITDENDLSSFINETDLS